jgi:iron complex outermembrane receptor protein
MFNQSITLEYRELSLGVNQTVFSKSYIDITNTNSMAGYFVYGVNVSYEKNNYRVSIQANNITDKKYYSNGYVANGVRYLYPNALASYYVTVKIRL